MPPGHRAGARSSTPEVTRDMEQLLWVSLGSAAGGGARYLVTAWALRVLGTAFPYGTLLVNVTGSFLVSVVMYAGIETGVIPPGLRLALTTGVMGGFTTYSTFSFETMRYLQEGALGIAAASVAATLAGCLLASFLGWATARLLLG